MPAECLTERHLSGGWWIIEVAVCHDPGLLRVVPLLQTMMMVGSNTPHSTPLHGVHSTTEGHLEGSLMRV